MDFEVTYTEEQQRFRHEVRAWLDANVTPGLTRIPVSDDDSRRRYHELRAFGRKLGARGWLYPRAPQAYGGGGLDVDHTIILEEEVDRVGLSLPPYYDSGGRLGSGRRHHRGAPRRRRVRHQRTEDLRGQRPRRRAHLDDRLHQPGRCPPR